MDTAVPELAIQHDDASGLYEQREEILAVHAEVNADRFGDPFSCRAIGSVWKPMPRGMALPWLRAGLMTSWLVLRSATLCRPDRAGGVAFGGM